VRLQATEASHGGIPKAPSENPRKNEADRGGTAENEEGISARTLQVRELASVEVCGF
jgi:hypothetical protein